MEYRPIGGIGRGAPVGATSGTTPGGVSNTVSIRGADSLSGGFGTESNIVGIGGNQNLGASQSGFGGGNQTPGSVSSDDSAGGGGGFGSGPGHGCRYCGRNGHFARDCPRAGAGGNHGSGCCSQYWQEGHIARDCPNAQSGLGGTDGNAGTTFFHSINRAMAESDTESDSAKPHLSCPICLELFENPKVLTCGHSLCAGCIPLAASGEVTCPICRTVTQPSANGLTTNYALRDLVEESKKKPEKVETHQCKACTKEYPMDEMWSCTECDITLICSMCVVKIHHSHKVQSMSELLEQSRLNYLEWRQLTTTMMDDIDMSLCQIYSNIFRAEVEIQVLEALRNGYNPYIQQIATDQVRIREDIRSNPVESVDQLVISGQLRGLLDGTMKSLKILTAKHRILKAQSALISDVIQSSSHIVHEALQRMLRLDQLAEQDMQNEERETERKRTADNVSSENAQECGQKSETASVSAKKNDDGHEKLGEDHEGFGTSTLPRGEHRQHDEESAADHAGEGGPGRGRGRGLRYALGINGDYRAPGGNTSASANAPQ